MCSAAKSNMSLVYAVMDNRPIFCRVSQKCNLQCEVEGLFLFLFLFGDVLIGCRLPER